ncbi:MAG: sigma 54-interacting transcriptional regulator [Clostridium sp.]|uniref:sigma-54-dependent Fis family transcriptional regulator n=1 Tax=Clostridium sp. TaxID=1506 RepID=UPI001EB3E948|nr:sigma 54-interacting transcriptional regulator [Clostridium sp.]MBS5884100.1 sigma 54-interacting transcriptional regulator [Clostridium sp.]MDU7148012.1 sigma 54-interacting transcriptional regulator [Clostridium sp.]MDU7241255.1 sigma 54-interacting transcriptional regulator [Clostridium sp.]
MYNKSLLIENSHKRSENYGVEKSRDHSKTMLNNEELKKVLEINKELIEISKPYIDMVVESVEDNDFIIILTDNNGCILYIKGANAIKDELEKLNLKVGAYMDEKNIGTNAMGTAITENRCIQITANEHYATIFQSLTCSAAPIHNSKGEIIGTLNLTGKSNMKHPHTLGLVIFGVTAIENELYRIKTNYILNQTYNYMKTVIENVDKGIMIIDIHGKIININELGLNILDKRNQNLINEYINHMIPNFQNIVDRISKNNETITKEIKLSHASKYKTEITLKGIKCNEKIIGIVATLTKLKEKNKENDFTGAFFTFNDIIGESDAIKNVIINCKIIANSPSTVLIQGESGTGKEVLAQSIHNYSIRKNNKFIAINCGAIPANIIESELFGYEDGTFTGGKKGGKIGKIELANGGTLFLDEIGEMPLDMQVKLLRVLQEGRVTRLGGSREIPVDMRVIAATNKNLKKEIKKGTFREDLYYRLCVIPIKLPPLRERKGDIRKFIEYFFSMKSIKLGKEIPEITKDLFNRLQGYNWPGNIRQLENCIENIVNLNGELSDDILEESEEKINEILDIDSKNISLDEVKEEECFNLEEIEKVTIKSAIEYNKYNMTKTARALGISRNTLYLKVKKYKIEI